MNRRTTHIFILMLSMALVASACGKKHQVGTKVGTGNGAGDGSGAFVLTTTSTATTLPKGGSSATTAKATATTAKATATTAGPEQPSFVIKIQSDNTPPSQFSPNQATCLHGRICRWINNDSIARSVVADDGSFSSPSIKPGGTWDYRPPAANGAHGYHDGTRPYAVAEVAFT